MDNTKSHLHNIDSTECSNKIFAKNGYESDAKRSCLISNPSCVCYHTRETAKSNASLLKVGRTARRTWKKFPTLPLCINMYLLYEKGWQLYKFNTKTGD